MVLPAVAAEVALADSSADEPVNFLPTGHGLAAVPLPLETTVRAENPIEPISPSETFRREVFVVDADEASPVGFPVRVALVVREADTVGWISNHWSRSTIRGCRSAARCWRYQPSGNGTCNASEPSPSDRWTGRHWGRSWPSADC